MGVLFIEFGLMLLSKWHEMVVKNDGRNVHLRKPAIILKYVYCTTEAQKQ